MVTKGDNNNTMNTSNEESDSSLELVSAAGPDGDNIQGSPAYFLAGLRWQHDNTNKSIKAATKQIQAKCKRAIDKVKTELRTELQETNK